MVIYWVTFLAGIDTAFAYLGLDQNFLFYLMAVCTPGSVFPIGFLVCWARVNKVSPVLADMGGLVMGIVAWIVTIREESRTDPKLLDIHCGSSNLS